MFVAACTAAAAVSREATKVGSQEPAERGGLSARELRFALGASGVYSRLKLSQASCSLRRFAGESPDESARRWARVHDGIGADLYGLCANLGGAYVKVGQFFATRPDLVPEQWCRHLGQLCDAVKPMDGAEALAIATQELKLEAHGRHVLTDWVDRPLGSASVAQVHAARLAVHRERPQAWWRRVLPWGRASGDRLVAVKVRRPEAAQFFARDLRAVQQAAAFVQRFELAFDLLSCVEELRDRVSLELDLRIEYEHLCTLGGGLRRASRGAIAAPEPILGTRQVLITELLDATPISAIARGLDLSATSATTGNEPSVASLPPSSGEPAPPPDIMAPTGSAQLAMPSGLGGLVARSAMRRGIADLYNVYGSMVLGSPTFHADPHPGNLMVPTEFGRAMALSAAREAVPPPFRWLLPYAPPRLYLIDFGQCGGPVSLARRQQLARLFLELADAGDVDFSTAPATAARVASALRALGVVKGGGMDDAIEADMARGMFDSAGDIDLGTRLSSAGGCRTSALPLPSTAA